jgi:hypothetical protein
MAWICSGRWCLYGYISRSITLDLTASTSTKWKQKKLLWRDIFFKWYVTMYLAISTLLELQCMLKMQSKSDMPFKIWSAFLLFEKLIKCKIHIFIIFSSTNLQQSSYLTIIFAHLFHSHAISSSLISIIHVLCSDNLLPMSLNI